LRWKDISKEEQILYIGSAVAIIVTIVGAIWAFMPIK
jgi:hypothetical protein